MKNRNRNFAITDEDHRRLKIMSAQCNLTLGTCIGRLLDLRDAMLAAEYQELLDAEDQNIRVAIAVRAVDEARARFEARRS